MTWLVKYIENRLEEVVGEGEQGMKQEGRRCRRKKERGP